jgi:8-oxo-dGTP pyrophosphatase MutT (NUDIX family)
MLSYSAENLCKCAGIILLKKNQDDTYSFVLVETRQKRFRYSFPKGKREVGEDTMTAAIRETFEETGLTGEFYKIIPNLYYFEYLNNGSFSKPHICYYVAILNDNFKEFAPIDQKEIVSCDLFTLDSIKNMITDFTYQRRVIASKLIKKINTFK